MFICNSITEKGELFSVLSMSSGVKDDVILVPRHTKVAITSRAVAAPIINDFRVKRDDKLRGHY